MKPARIITLLVISLAVLALAACGPAAAPAGQVVVVKETVVVEQPAAAAPVVAAPAEATQPGYAPFCQSAPAGCEAPEVEMLDNKYCVKKIPYAIMSVPAGTTYESLDPDLECQDQAHSDGSLRITCSSGRELWSYDLKVCNGACSAPNLVMDSPQCPAGYGFDAANQCCAQPAAGGDAGCVVYQVDIGACPMPQ
jgi:hypothetical protein